MPWNPDRILVYRKSPHPRHAAAPAGATPDLARKQRVGIWDLDATAGQLPQLLDAIEERQTYFSFYSVEAAFQSGLTRPGLHVAREWHERTGRTMTRADAARNVAARPIAAAAKPVLAGLPVDWLIVVVRSMIADTIDRSDTWLNLFSTTHGRVVIVSTFGLRGYAAKAGRPFESAVMGSALAALLSAMLPAIAYQKVTTGSIFDFCWVRDDIVRSIQKPTIDPRNRAVIPGEILEAADGILDVLATYKGSATRAQFRRQLVVTARHTKAVRRASAMNAAAPAASFDDILKQLSASLSTRTRTKRKR